MKKVIALSSSQIAVFHQCPQKWNYLCAQELGPPIPFTKPAPDKGTVIHAVLEKYYRLRFTDVGAAMKSISDKWEFEPSTDPKKESPVEAWNRRTPEEQTFLRSLMLQYAAVKSITGDFTPLTQESVELGFSSIIYEDDDWIFALEGRIDLLAADSQISERRKMVDHKAQVKAERLYLRRPQFQTYCLASKTSTLIVNYIRLHKEMQSRTFERDAITFSKSDMDYWRDYLVRAVFGKIARWEIEKDHGACGGAMDKYPCIFSDVCYEQDSEIAQRILAQRFVKVEGRRSW